MSPEVQNRSTSEPTKRTYVLQKFLKKEKEEGSTATLAVKRSASVAPKVNLRNPLDASEETCRRGIHLDFETQTRCHQKFKTGVSVAQRKWLMSSKNLQKKTMILTNTYVVITVPGIARSALCTRVCCCTSPTVRGTSWKNARHFNKYLMPAVKRLAGIAPEVNVRERTSHTPPPIANKVTHSSCETQRRCHQKSKNRGKDKCPPKILKKVFVH